MSEIVMDDGVVYEARGDSQKAVIIRYPGAPHERVVGKLLPRANLARQVVIDGMEGSGRSVIAAVRDAHARIASRRLPRGANEDTDKHHRFACPECDADEGFWFYEITGINGYRRWTLACRVCRFPAYGWYDEEPELAPDGYDFDEEA